MRSALRQDEVIVALLCGACVLGDARAALDTQYSGGVSLRFDSTTTFSDSYNRMDPGGQGSVNYMQNSIPEVPEYPYVVLRATSSAGNTYVSASTFAQFVKGAPGGGGFNHSGGGLAYAGVFWDDFVIHGPPGGVVTRLGAKLTGRVSVGTSDHFMGSCSVQVAIWVNGSITGSGTYVEQTDGGNKTINQSGGLVGFGGVATIMTNAAFLPTNTPIRIGLQLTTSSQISFNYQFSGNGSANTDFGSTFRLLTDQPLFDLPPGYTASSAQANVINNYFIDPCPADFNHDALVDDADFTVFVAGYNVLDCTDSAMSPGCPADLNDDAFVDDADFVLFLAAYNELICP